jgi:hypothetical protein
MGLATEDAGARSCVVNLCPARLLELCGAIATSGETLYLVKVVCLARRVAGARASA